jgi:hypothetical protein
MLYRSYDNDGATYSLDKNGTLTYTIGKQNLIIENYHPDKHCLGITLEERNAAVTGTVIGMQVWNFHSVSQASWRLVTEQFTPGASQTLSNEAFPAKAPNLVLRR